MTLKEEQHYLKIIKKYDEEGRIKPIWDAQYAHSTYIGYCTEIHRTWLQTRDITIPPTLQEFADYYFKHGKTEEELKKVAEQFANKIKKLPNIDPFFTEPDNVMDCVIGHALVQTHMGQIKEYKMKKYVQDVLGLEIPLQDYEKHDKNYGIDFICKGKKAFKGVQVKSIFFFLSKSPICVKEKYSMYKRFENFIKSDSNKYNLSNPHEDLLLTVYDYHTDMWLTFDGKTPFIKFTYGIKEIEKLDWYRIKNDKSLWMKLPKK